VHIHRLQQLVPLRMDWRDTEPMRLHLHLEVCTRGRCICGVHQRRVGPKHPCGRRVDRCNRMRATCNRSTRGQSRNLSGCGSKGGSLGMTGLVVTCVLRHKGPRTQLGWYLDPPVVVYEGRLCRIFRGWRGRCTGRRGALSVDGEGQGVVPVRLGVRVGGRRAHPPVAVALTIGRRWCERRRRGKRVCAVLERGRGGVRKEVELHAVRGGARAGGGARGTWARAQGWRVAGADSWDGDSGTGLGWGAACGSC
jgi:hypothetical protein